MSENLDGVWRTIGGRRVFIKNGQDLATAMKESGKFKDIQEKNKIRMESKIQKKLEKKVVDDMINGIEKAKEENEKFYKLSLKENNIVKEINPKYSFDRLGEWNGYGREKLGKHLKEENYDEVLEELKIVKQNNQIKGSNTRILTEEDKKEAWANRLSKLTGISKKEALEIAEEKIQYKNDKITEVSNRQADRYSRQREKLIKQMERENPLRRIEDEEHAQRILIASERHNTTDYENLLEEAREKALYGDIDKSDIKEYARKKYKKL